MVCQEMAFLPHTPSSDHHHHQYFFQNHHHLQQQQQQEQLDHEDTNLSILSNSFPSQHEFHGGHVPPTLAMMRSPVMSGCGGGEYQGHGGGGEEHDDLSDDGSHLVGLGEKKKRLSLEQVKTLEKNFEMGNKLEPERKVQLAKALGLQPRQVAIWFQNRRARWKTKQLEKDYNLLRRQFDALKSDNDSLLSHNKNLHAQLLALKSGATNATNAHAQEGGTGTGTELGSINLNATTKSYCWNNNGSEISSDINLGISTTRPEESPSSNKLQFQSSFLPTSLTDLLTSSSSAPKPSDHGHPHHQDDTFCSLFSGGPAGGGAGGGGGVVGEQPPFWAWAPDQHHLH